MSTTQACLLLVLLLAGAQGCPSPRRLSTTVTCARLYEHVGCRGDHLDAYNGEYNLNVGDNWNDKVSSLVVLPSCQITLHEHTSYGGISRRFGSHSGSGETAYILSSYHMYCCWWTRNVSWDNQMTSFVCTCQGYKK